jgi:phosphoglycolate phosphatase-like HAD superfamily hydrolase
VALIDPIDPPLGEGDAVLFDMDGTLLFLPVDIDSVRDRLSDFHRGYGLDMAFRPLTDDLSAAASRLEEMLSPAEARAAQRWARATVEQAEVDAAGRVQPREGCLGAFRLLVERGVRLAVVSNNTRRGIRAALQAVDIDPDGLDALVSRDDVHSPKPAPDMVELALRSLAAEGWDPVGDEERPARWWMVGDGPSDVMAATSCRADRVHPRLPRGKIVVVGGGLAGRGTLAGPGVDHVLTDDRAAFDLLVGTGHQGEAG